MWFRRLSPLKQQILLLVGMVIVGVGAKLAFKQLFQKPFGQYCQKATDCRSGLCSSQGYCSQLCSVDSDCPQGYTCWDLPTTQSALEFKWAREGNPVSSRNMKRVCR